MLNTKSWLVLAGDPRAWDEEMLRRCSGEGGEALTAVQEDQHERGRRDAQLVRTLYGFSVRSATGLDNFEILYGGRDSQVDKSKSACLRFGVEWALSDPSNRSFIARTSDVDPDDLALVRTLGGGPAEL